MTCRARVAALLLAAALAPSAASAFDSAEWLACREVLTREAERLQAAFSNCAARVSRPASGIVLPLETHEDGSVKLVVEAKRGEFFLKENLIWAEDLVVRKFDEDRVEVSRIESRRCLIDRLSKCGWSEGETTFVHGKTVFRGEGVFFSPSDGYVISFRRSRIDSTDMKFGGAL